MVICLFFTLAYFYHFVYMVRVWARGHGKAGPGKEAALLAFFISPHNEEPVIR